MAVFKCKMCGGEISFELGESVGTCEFCGTKQTLPRLDTDEKKNLYDRANHFRRNNEYDKAISIYEQILSKDTTDSETYWSLVLCNYGIEYVEEPSSHRRVPTVNRAQFTSIFEDEHYKLALKYADTLQRTIYEKEALEINEIQKGILAVSQKEEPYDVFICYKETDTDGRRTLDSLLAYDIYKQLVQEGLKVFFSRVTLEDKLGIAYEPYIFAAINTSKVMIVLGTKPEYFYSVWVKNEWSRYLSLVKKCQGRKILIPAFKDMDPSNLPVEFSYLQAQDMSKIGSMQELIRGIKKIVYSDSKERVLENRKQDNYEIKDFSDKLSQLHMELANAKSNVFVSAFGYNKKNDIEDKIINLIKDYPIPNSIQAINEFVILASSNINATTFNTFGYSQSGSTSQDEWRRMVRESSAWDAKMEQAYNKALIMFSKSPEFEKIEKIYRKTKTDIEQAKSGGHKFYTALIAFVVLMGLVFLCVFAIIISDNSKKNSSANSYSTNYENKDPNKNSNSNQNDEQVKTYDYYKKSLQGTPENTPAIDINALNVDAVYPRSDFGTPLFKNINLAPETIYHTLASENGLKYTPYIITGKVIKTGNSNFEFYRFMGDEPEEDDTDYERFWFVLENEYGKVYFYDRATSDRKDFQGRKNNGEFNDNESGMRWVNFFISNCGYEKYEHPKEGEEVAVLGIYKGLMLRYDLPSMILGINEFYYDWIVDNNY